MARKPQKINRRKSSRVYQEGKKEEETKKNGEKKV